ncbi:hypothetical protein AHMF7605_27395 [Adhaeribacter arboris]|uniref:Uncharacterized protein n=2 Tax=Adhaeribacter arboris TaxID=2072846 RepID=A0A2T2YPN1_9BACT|nr:hypothetical protein AHMF7605_27395 [Adhaeribacter arboris]
MSFDYQIFSVDATVFALYNDGIEPAKVFTFIENSIVDEIIAVLVIVGGILAAFSQEKQEDEYIAKIRLESLLWATYINYGLLLFSILFVYGLGFYQIMIFHMFTVLFIFLIRFNFILYRTSKAMA